MIFGLSLPQILGILGVPSLATIFSHIYLKLKANEKETEAIKLGIQALLRSQMIADFNKWNEKGYAPLYARDNFENCWKNYETLGFNGVMNDIHEKFMDLPVIKEKK